MEAYPLHQVLKVKQDRAEKAQKMRDAAKATLDQEQEKLKGVEKQRDEVKQHHHDKLMQLRQAFDKGTTSEEVIIMKDYLKVVKEKLKQEELKVEQQKKVCQQAKVKWEEAAALYRKRKLEEEKIKLHKKEWSQEHQRMLEQKAQKEEDELGSVMHQATKRAKRDRI